MTPFVISWFLVAIEIISYSSRLFSLSIRLCANLMSGHTLLHIIASSIWLGVTSVCVIPFLVGPIPICALELVIAVIQAYVFTTLLSLYVSDSFYSH